MVHWEGIISVVFYIYLKRILTIFVDSDLTFSTLFMVRFVVFIGGGILLECIAGELDVFVVICPLLVFTVVVKVVVSNVVIGVSFLL